jgi:hypothetical protein
MSPKKQSLQQNKAALEGNQALKFMLPKQGRQKIIKDVHKDPIKNMEEQFERDLAGRRAAMIGTNHTI